MTSTISATMDTSGLKTVIPDLVAYGRRTMREQCVTSMGMILQDAQTWTPFVDIGRMDQELDAPAENQRLAALGYSQGDAIVLARAAPGSNFNRMTGGRWAITLPKTASMRNFGRAYGSQNGAQMFLDAVIRPIMERMRASRHSSGHFLQAGYKEARDYCVRSEFFKNRYRKQSGKANDNPLNTLDSSDFGGTEIVIAGDHCAVVSTNDVGEGGSTALLDAEHRRALIAYGSGPLQDAVDKEAAACVTELRRRIGESWPLFNEMLK